MYLSTIFLSDIDNGVEHAITKCNEEFLKRFGSIQDYISASITRDFSGKVLQMMRSWLCGMSLKILKMKYFLVFRLLKQ